MGVSGDSSDRLNNGSRLEMVFRAVQTCLSPSSTSGHSGFERDLRSNVMLELDVNKLVTMLFILN